jgi:two-component system, cell cycle response regulator
MLSHADRAPPEHALADDVREARPVAAASLKVLVARSKIRVNMARIRRPRAAHQHRIAVIDDDAALRESTIRLFASEGHEVLGAATVGEGIELVRGWKPDLILLDYLLEHGTGADVVAAIRTFDTLVQVLLVTGYANEHPARKLLADLDINGFHDKGDGLQRFQVLVDASLKHFRALQLARRQQSNLRHVIHALPALMSRQPPPELLRTALDQLGGLLDVASGVVATVNSGLLVLSEPTGVMIEVRAATGAYQGASGLDDLPSPVAGAVRQGLLLDRPTATNDGLVILPLRTRGGDRGVMVVAAAGLPDHAVEACEIFAQQVMLSLENVLLHERSTIDPLTSLWNRGFGEERLDQVLRLAARTDEWTSVIVVDVDRFKQVNDRHGHAAGDLTLREIARVLRSAVRTTDVVARWGGEEILLILPATDPAGARLLADRLVVALRAIEVRVDGAVIRPTASLGVASAMAATARPEELVQRADRAMYRAKQAGRDRVCSDDESPSQTRGEEQHALDLARSP